MVKVSEKIQSDDSFPRIIDRKIFFRYIEVYILDNLSSPPQKFFSSTWRRDATASLDNVLVEIRESRSIV